MVIGILQIELFMGQVQSLKEKRMILKSLKTRLHNSFNIAVSELARHEKWQRSLIGIASINNEKKILDILFTKIVEVVDKEKDVEISDYSTEFL